MSWTKLKRGNDWGVDYFYRPDRPKTPAGTYGRESGVDFEDGSAIKIRWPDGAETEETVVKRGHSGEVYDHGHTYGVAFKLAGIAIDVHGIETWVPLDALEVWMPVPSPGDGSRNSG